VTRELIEDAGNGLIIAFTESIPDHAWRTSLPAIVEAIEEAAS
jgi:hypothetical protein